MNEELKKEFSKLRFVDENGETYPEWEEVKFDELLKAAPNRNYQIESSQVLDEGNIPVIDQGKSFIAGFSNESSKIFPRNNKNYIVYGDHTTVVKYIDFDFMLGGDGTKVLDLKKPENSIKFAYHSLCFNNAEPEGYKRHFSILRKKSFPIPSLSEQTKIADFLSNLDKRIEAQSKLVELLKEQKQGYSQRLFNGSLRFKKDDGTDYEDWEEKKLGEMFDRVSKKGRADLPYITVMENRTVERAEQHQGYANKETEKKKKASKILLINDFLIDLTSYERGIYVSKMDGLTSNAYTVLRAKEQHSVIYWKNFFVSHSFVESLKTITPIGARQGKMIEVSRLLEFLINLPSLPEQEKIAAFLSSLDKRIDEELNILEQLKLEKNGYMQRVLG